MFAGVNMFWAQLRLIFLAQAIRRELKWALRRAQNTFMHENINNYSTVIITFEDIEKTKTEKSYNKTVWGIFPSPAL